MSFCGSQKTLRKTNVPVWTLSECMADGLYLVPSLAVILVTTAALVIRTIKQRTRHEKNTHNLPVKFPAHNTRWILSLILLIIQLTELAEGAISEQLYQGRNMHLYIPLVFSLLAVGTTLGWYTSAERQNLPRMLLLLLTYWSITMVLRTLKLVVLFRVRLGVSHLRLYLVFLECSLHGFLFLVDLYVMCTLKYFSRKPNTVQAPEELQYIRYIHPYTSFLSQVTWHWLTPLLVQGYKHPTEMKDLGKLPQTEHSSYNAAKLQQAFGEEKLTATVRGKTASLWKCYFKTFWPMIVLGGFYKLLADMLVFVGPLCLEGIIHYVIHHKTQNKNLKGNHTLPMEPQYISPGQFFSNGYVLAFLVLLSTVLQAVLMQNHFYLSIRNGIRIKGAIQAMVYKKAMRLSCHTLTGAGTSHGEVLNHMVVDPMNLVMFFYFIHWGWTLPIQVIIVFVLLYRQLGASALISGVVLILMLPLQYRLGKIMARIQTQALKEADTRIKKSCDLIQSVKLLKLYAWEFIFSQSVEDTRNRELVCLLKAGITRAMCVFLSDGAAPCAALITFILYPFLESQPLTTGKVFSGLALFNILGVPLFIITMIIKTISHAHVSSKRLLEFFLTPEIESSQFTKSDEQKREIHCSELLTSTTSATHKDFEELVEMTPGIHDTNEYSVLSVSTKSMPDFHNNRKKSIPLDISCVRRLTQSYTKSHVSVHLSNKGDDTDVFKKIDTSNTIHTPDIISASDDFDASNRNDTADTVDGSNTISTSNTNDAWDTVDASNTISASNTVHAYNTSVAMDTIDASNITEALDDIDVSNNTDASNYFDVSNNIDASNYIGVSNNTDASAYINVLNNIDAPDNTDVSNIIDASDNIDVSNNIDASVGQSEVFLEEEDVMQIHNGSFSWDLEGKNLILENINIRIPRGKLTVVIGPVGSGKSSLVSAMLGEMNTVEGSIEWTREADVAYSSQTAWLMNTTLRDNITFATPFDSVRYDRVLEVCALKPDLHVLPAGDITEIGEKGINLSGGQKQRVSLARAIYSCKSVVIMDDPLSALDVHVGSHVFHKGIRQFLLQSGRTVILVTHQLQYLPHADQVIMMSDGHVTDQGMLGEIKERNPELSKSWTSALQHRKWEQKEEHIYATPGKSKKMSYQELAVRRRSSVLAQLSPYRSPALSICDLPPDDNDNEMSEVKGHADIDGEDSEAGRLVRDEEHIKGRVSMKVYLQYVKSSAWWAASLTLLGFISKQTVRLYGDYTLSQWAEAAETTKNYTNSSSNSTVSHMEMGYDCRPYLIQYGVLAGSGILIGAIANICLEYSCWTAARDLHRKMLHRVVQAPLRFFDTTPLGRIINRFSGDINTIDERMSMTLDALIFCTLFILGALIVNAITAPYFIIPAIPLFLVYLAIQRFYIATSRELQRLDSISKSPVLNHFSQTLTGLTTIRAYGDEERFLKQSQQTIDDNNTAYLYLHTANVWMGLRLDVLGGFIIFTSAVASITSAVYGSATPGLVGISITYSLMMCSLLNWLMRMVSEGELWFSAVERVAHYMQLPQEGVGNSQEVTPDPEWPSTGEVVFSDVSLRYDVTLDPVIKGISFRVNSGEKVGICGRTGSGKSSTALGLFRMIDICHGSIYIDGVDITKVPLHTLRSRLSIIPQEPILFEGTVRYNLDPESLHTDEQIWQSLEIAQLKGIIEEIPQQLGLESPVSGSGENFSVGQRQLFCLARAFLRNSSVLVMDEATASVDLETDKIIQKVIRSAFQDRTVLTIAHRISSILDSDLIIVLKHGMVIEQGSPQSLLDQPGSLFSSMVKDNK